MTSDLAMINYAHSEQMIFLSFPQFYFRGGHSRLNKDFNQTYLPEVRQPIIELKACEVTRGLTQTTILYAYVETHQTDIAREFVHKVVFANKFNTINVGEAKYFYRKVI